MLTSFNIQKQFIKLGSVLTDNPADLIIYIIPPDIDSLSIIVAQMKRDDEEKRKRGGSKDKEYHIIFIPKITNECHIFIKQSNFEAYFTHHNLNIEVYPLDYDLISLEMPSFKDIFIDENLSSLSVLSRTIAKFEDIFGKIKHKYIKGTYSKILNDLLENDEIVYDVKNDDEILACVMMDRSVDYITPFLTQFTYEGMLNEYFNIQYNMIKVEPKLLDSESKQNKIAVDLSKNDRFYTMIKDYHFNYIRIFLGKRNKLHTEIIARTKNSREMKEIQAGLKIIQAIGLEKASLTTHINLATHIADQQYSPHFKYALSIEQRLLIPDKVDILLDFFDKELGKQCDIYSFLKILCLESLTIGKIKGKVYDSIKNDFIKVYGFQEIFLLNNLEKLKILKKKETNTFYEFIQTKMRLINDSVNTIEPDDTAYVFGGFCPLSIRLVEKVIQDGWGSIKDIMTKIPGITEYPNDENEILRSYNDKNIILLVYVGGITYAEIAAIRYLNNRPGTKYKFIIMTTSIISPKSFIDELRFKRDPIPENEEDQKEEDPEQMKGPLSFRSFYSQLKKIIK